jgi:hypothetical protein
MVTQMSCVRHLFGSAPRTWCVLISVLLARPSNAGIDAGAVFTTLPADLRITAQSPAVVVSATFTLAAVVAESVVLSDGRFFPIGGAHASVGLWVDGRRVGAEQWIAWDPTNTTTAVQHSFSLVGASGELEAGEHTVELVAWTSNGAPFMVGSGSGVGVLPLPAAARVGTALLPSDTPRLEFDLPPWDNQSKPFKLPLANVLVADVPGGADGPIIALASGRSYISPGPGRTPHSAMGDAYWMLTLDNSTTIRNNETLHSDNDICFCAEAGSAPMMTHGFFPISAGEHGSYPPRATHTVALAASAEPWNSAVHVPGFAPGVNPVQYRVGARAGIVAVAGLPVMGRAVLTTKADAPHDFVCVGTSKGWAACPPVGEPQVLASASFQVPPGHSGEVAFVAKSIVQADGADGGGTVVLRLRVDGVVVGSVGVQQLSPPSTVSTRTISASHVSGGAARLAPGNHTVEAVVTVAGDFVHLCMSKDLPLLWFG